MLTRHSPLHAHGGAEAGWLVGESDGQFRPVSLGTTAPGCLLKKLKSHFRLRRGSRPGQVRDRLAQCQRNKKIPRADARVMPRARSRSNRSSRTNKRPTGSLLVRVRAETPTSKLETSTVVVKPYPQPRRGQLPMESHPAMIRNPSSFSKKILLDRTEFSK
jgi:hypothetical protein